nr:hypothetical protein [Tanacetum cinerariifolium]
MLVEAQEASQILDEEKIAFIADLGIAKTLVAQQTIPQNSAFQTEDLDAYDSDCNDISSAKAVLMKNISSCDLDILFEVPYSDTYPNDMINPDVQKMLYSEQTHIVGFLDNEITIDSNIILYSQYLFLALGWYLEEIHVTWAYLEKKRTRLRTYTKSMKKYCSQSVETGMHKVTLS